LGKKKDAVSGAALKKKKSGPGKAAPLGVKEGDGKQTRRNEPE